MFTLDTGPGTQLVLGMWAFASSFSGPLSSAET